ncbi:hypothetical protein [Croceitalea rosinachiae]|uniref:Uncharacterized protein n=1 Tax=Croceitalea rosinachiae TaxID=3075596 RepID=A0ABU3AET3_9FLAO|nr:hypothetical protein [Croceitalea sp. F388]MDT0608433.1 hypothetical protein [Croceitalea sp. F388]
MFRLILIVAILTFSCKSQKNEQFSSGMNTDNDLILVLEDNFATDTLLTITINDQKALNSFFAKVNRTRKPGIPVPTIDFNKEMIAIVCAGAQKGVESIRLFRANETETTIEIGIEKLKNKSDSKLISYPFCIYKLPKTNKAITFD